MTAQENAPRLRFRVDFGRRCSVGVGKIELLEGISRTGSLSQAAREMHMSYRRAWLLLEDMNSAFDCAVANASVGGRGGGGVVLTPFGLSLVIGYRQLECRLQPLAASCLKPLAGHMKAGRPGKGLKSTSIKRKSPQRASPQ